MIRGETSNTKGCPLNQRDHYYMDFIYIKRVQFYVSSDL